MKKYKIVTLGCKVNSYESQAVKEMLDANGYIESDDENLDLVIVNTCAVTQMAEHKSRQKISSFSKKYPNAIIVSCGCSSQLHPEKISKVEGADIIIGNNNHSELLDLIKEYENDNHQIVKVDKSTRLRTYQHLKISSFDEKVRAFVKIGDGCNNFCSYCIIPLTRGNLRSRPKEEILCEIDTLVNNGYKEIVITGIDSASYGIDLENYRFIDLMRDILKNKKLRRLRISSIEASQIEEDFIELMKNNETIARHLHIPLQSGSKTVLERMKRKYTKEEFLDKIRYIQKELPDVALACDVIVGFPGETEEEFMETYNFIQECNFAFLHVFPYSIREGTAAAVMKNQVSDVVKKERVRRLIKLGEELSDKYKAKFKGKELNVLVESYDKKKKMYHGLSENYLDVYIDSDDNLINEIIKVKY